MWEEKQAWRLWNLQELGTLPGTQRGRSFQRVLVASPSSAEEFAAQVLGLGMAEPPPVMGKRGNLGRVPAGASYEGAAAPRRGGNLIKSNAERASTVHWRWLQPPPPLFFPSSLATSARVKVLRFRRCSLAR